MSGIKKLIALAQKYVDFKDMVNHKARWDIKRKEPWEETIGTEYPGYDVEVIYRDLIVTPENLGNITYGYLGAANGIPLNILYFGSYYAAGMPIGGAKFENELLDQTYIAYGYDAYFRDYD